MIKNLKKKQKVKATRNNPLANKFEYFYDIS